MAAYAPQSRIFRPLRLKKEPLSPRQGSTFLRPFSGCVLIGAVMAGFLLPLKKNPLFVMHACLVLLRWLP